MLKKHNKLVMLVLLVAFMFSIVGSAAAASFSDVSGNDVEASAIYKLNSLGVINGYPDGTFGPERTITRAEFAKIACVTAGLEAVASGMTDVPSSFSDVSADFWGNGWINVAAAQGFVKGYPDGTFAPDAQITQAEVTTVLLRILGYNDNLPGNWPSDYIAKAANLGVLDDVTFVANKAATRGEVAVLAGATLDEDVVDYKASDNIFDSKGQTLLADKFDDAAKTEKVLVLDVDLSDDAALKIASWAEDGTLSTSSVKLADNYVVAGADNIIGVADRMVDYMVNDDGDIVYITVKDYDVISSDTVEVSKAANSDDAADGSYTVSNIQKVKVEGETYDMAADFAVYVENDPETASTTVAVNSDSEYSNKDLVDVVLDKDGDVKLIRGYNYFVPAVVDDVTNTKNTVKISFKDPGTHVDGISGKNLKDEDVFVEKNGAVAELADLEENDLVVVYANYRGVDYYIQAFNTIVSGEFTAVKSSGLNLDKITVGGTEYKAGNYDGAAGPYLFVDGGEDIDKDAVKTADIDGDGDFNLFNEELVLLLTPANRVAAIVSDSEGSADTGRIYASVIKTYNEYVDGDMHDLVKVYRLNDDTEVTYVIDNDAQFRSASDVDTYGSYADFSDVATELKQDDFIYFNLTSDGYVNKVSKLAYNLATVPAGVNEDVTTVDTDANTIKIDGVWYEAEDAVFANIKNTAGNDDSEDTEAAKWADVKDFIDDGNTLNMSYYVDGSELKYAVIETASLAGDSNVAIFKTYGKDSDGVYVTLVEGEEYVKYYVTDASEDEAKAIASGDVFRMQWDAGKVDINGNSAITGAVANEVYKSTLNDINNNSIVIADGSSYLVNADTKYFDVTDTDAPFEITKDDLAKGSAVLVLLNTNEDLAVRADKALTAVILIEE